MSGGDEKMLVNSLYHSSVIAGLTIGYAQILKSIFKVKPPTLDFSTKDMGFTLLDITLAIASRDFLVKQGILPSNILK